MDLNFSELQGWYNEGSRPPFISGNWCANRADFNGRLASYEKVLAKDFSEDCKYLVLSLLGELGNNCFDHNLGFWQDEPGCLFIRAEKFCVVADRGRGIKQSLREVMRLQNISGKPLEVAYGQVISGRAPEKRGNGLKFVKKVIRDCKLRLVTFSDADHISFGKDSERLVSQLDNFRNAGVLNVIWWSDEN